MKFSSIFLSLIGLLLFQCTERACTEIGCMDGLVITCELEEYTRAEVLIFPANIPVGVVHSYRLNDTKDLYIIDVKLFKDSTLINSYTQAIVYKTTRPNRKGCDPECNQSSVTISD